MEDDSNICMNIDDEIEAITDDESNGFVSFAGQGFKLGSS
jgi:hypothetical protein